LSCWSTSCPAISKATDPGSNIKSLVKIDHLCLSPRHPNEPHEERKNPWPRAWTADDVRQDDSWIQRLSAAEVEGFDLALQHARRLNKPLLAMAQADFPLTDASRTALERAIATTQTGFGMCLVKGFPVDRWSEADTRLAYWGMSLYMGVGRTQNRASQVMNDVRDEGGEVVSAGSRAGIGPLAAPSAAGLDTRPGPQH
jgi:hypothetical protein